jgi:hypothetical protein
MSDIKFFLPLCGETDQQWAESSQCMLGVFPVHLRQKGEVNSLGEVDHHIRQGKGRGDRDEPGALTTSPQGT